MHRMAAGLPLGWQIDLEDLGNEHGKPKIQPCNACASSSVALCPAIATGRIAITRPTFFGTWTSTPAWREPTPWAFIGPINWYGSTSNFKLLFDRLVCMNGGNPRPDLIGKGARFWRKLSSVQPNGENCPRTIWRAVQPPSFCYGDRGAADLDAAGRPKILTHKGWFDPKDEPYDNERNAYQSLIWQCRYSGIEVPDSLWSYAEIGVGKL
jgi:hypothetical protein